MNCADCPCFVSNRFSDMWSCALFDNSNDERQLGIKYGRCGITEQAAYNSLDILLENYVWAERHKLPSYKLKENRDGQQND